MHGKVGGMIDYWVSPHADDNKDCASEWLELERAFTVGTTRLT